MSKTKYKLPTRKWYTLEQAIKKISKKTGEELEVEDLFHYWINQKLPLATRVIITNEAVKIGNVVIHDEEFKFFYDSNMSLLDNECDDNVSEFIPITETQQKEIEEFIRPDYVAKNINIYYSYDEYMCFFTIDGSSKNISKKRGLKIEEIALLIFPNIRDKNKTYFHFSLINELWDYDLYLKPKEIVILHDDLEAFLNGDEIDLQIDLKKVHPKTLNTQAEFIRNLITIHYGEKVANNIRNELENPRSRITCDFEKNGLKPAVGKTVDSWINQI